MPTPERLKSMMPTSTAAPVSPRQILPVDAEQGGDPEKAIAPLVDDVFSSYSGMVADRFRSDAALTRAREGALMALRANPHLWGAAMADRHGLSVAIIKTLRMGLDLDPGLGHAYIVPRRARKGEPARLQLEIGYRGMLHLARRAGIVSAFGEVVYDGDRFEVHRGTDPRIEHAPTYTNRGDAICVYAVARLAEGVFEFEVLTLDEVDLARKKSTAQNGTAWRDHWAEMAKKTALRRLLKRLPVRLDDPDEGFTAAPVSDPASTMKAPASEPVSTEGQKRVRDAWAEAAELGDDGPRETNTNTNVDSE